MLAWLEIHVWGLKQLAQTVISCCRMKCLIRVYKIIAEEFRTKFWKVKKMIRYNIYMKWIIRSKKYGQSIEQIRVQSSRQRVLYYWRVCLKALVKIEMVFFCPIYEMLLFKVEWTNFLFVNREKVCFIPWAEISVFICSECFQQIIFGPNLHFIYYANKAMHYA